MVRRSVGVQVLDPADRHMTSLVTTSAAASAGTRRTDNRRVALSGALHPGLLV